MLELVPESGTVSTSIQDGSIDHQRMARSLPDPSASGAITSDPALMIRHFKSDWPFFYFLVPNNP